MTIVIAEAGVNHNGDMDLAIELVEVAASAGADLVKFQTFNAQSLVTRSARRAEYQTRNVGGTDSQFEMLRKLELSPQMHFDLKSHSESLGVEFLSTAFDSESLRFLVDDVGLTRLKIASGEITNAPLILEHAKQGLPLIISTGMSTLKEVREALSVIAYGFIAEVSASPSTADFFDAFNTPEGQKALREKVTILHCTTEYPAPSDELNLSAITTMNEEFGLPVGYSDHSNGILAALVATSFGATVIEKHITLDRGLPGPDHLASLEPSELKEMVRLIKKVPMMIGSGVKAPTESELKNKVIARKSLIAAVPIFKGQLIKQSDIAVLRPGSGMHPANYWSVVDAHAKRDYKAGELLDE